MHAKGIDKPLCDEDGGVYSDVSSRSRDKSGVECRERRDECCTCEAIEVRVNDQVVLQLDCDTPDTSRHCYLAE